MSLSSRAHPIMSPRKARIDDPRVKTPITAWHSTRPCAQSLELPTGSMMRPRAASRESSEEDFLDGFTLCTSERDNRLPSQPAIVMSRTSSALRLQSAIRCASARRTLMKSKGAAIFLQKILRGWVTRVSVRRRWQKSVNDLRRAARADIHHFASQRLPPPTLLPPPVRVLDRSRSGICTLRLHDRAEVAAARLFSPQHFDLVTKDELLHDALCTLLKRDSSNQPVHVPTTVLSHYSRSCPATCTPAC